MPVASPPHLTTPAHEWLARTAPDRAAPARDWARGRLAPIPSTGTWRVVETPLYPSSIDTMYAIRRANELGPVLSSARAPLVWWLVPADHAALIRRVPGLTVHPAGWVLDCPSLGPGIEGRGWLAPPDGSGRLTPGLLLRDAYQYAARGGVR